MRRPATLLTLSLTMLTALPITLPLAAQDDWGGETSCGGVLDAPARLAASLGQVGKYGSTYVLVVSEANAAVLETLDPAQIAELTVAVYDGSPAAELARELGVTRLETRSPDDATKIVDEVLTGELDAGLLWAPLAGVGVLELDFNYELSLKTIGTPAAPPVSYSSATAAADDACAAEVESTLGGYGVVPAEKLVPVDIRTLLDRRPPPRSLTDAKRGARLYAEICAKCHGPDAVAATDALAPVDILASTPRFSFPGFLYITLNGRPSKSMPGFRGTLTEDEITLIYQYARERAHGRSPEELGGRLGVLGQDTSP